MLKEGGVNMGGKKLEYQVRERYTTNCQKEELLVFLQRLENLSQQYRLTTN